MSIKGIDVTAARMREAYGVGQPAPTGPSDSSFAKRLSEMVQDVDGLMDHSADVQQRLISGEPIDVHDVTIAGQEAGLAFKLMVEVRNKLVEAYQELMRLQV